MLRSIFEHSGKSAKANIKANSELATGMGIVIDGTTAKLPAAETADDIYVVNKARVLSGVDAGRTEVSDYLDLFNKVKSGEFLVAENFDFGEEFATDQYKAADMVSANKGKRVSVGTDGKWMVATKTTVSSKYVFIDTYTDNGHTLARIGVSDTAKANTDS